MSASPDPRFGLNKSVSFAGGPPLQLPGGVSLPALTIGYETYGTLNAARSNAVLICHALSGDQFVASRNPVTGRDGWWCRVVGPGLAIDTDKYFVICSNVLGGCMGTTGPGSPHADPAFDGPWGREFPAVYIEDMVRVQVQLIDYLGIEQLHGVVGGSMGGMQVLKWVVDYAHRVRAACVIACAARQSAQNIAFHEVGRQAIMADPEWCMGQYYNAEGPQDGLAVARMLAHITYMSQQSLADKFGRQMAETFADPFIFSPDFQVQSYLRHQGESFVDRFDANSYLYLTRAMDHFDLGPSRHQPLSHSFRNCPTAVCVISFTSDWLYSTAESRQLVRAMIAAGVRVSFVELTTTHGHDSFLLENPDLWNVMQGFLASASVL